MSKSEKISPEDFEAQSERMLRLMKLFDKSDRRGQDLLLAMARIHSERYPKEGK